MSKRDERRRAIGNAVLAEGSVRIEDLAERFNVSAMTVHRDLDELEERGLIRKVRGAATALPNSLVESSDTYRLGQNVDVKRSLAAATLQFIEPGQAVFLDDSTTVHQVTPLLAEKTPLTAITNFLPNIDALRGTLGVDLVALGGTYRKWCSSFMGRMTTAMIEQLRADVFLASTAAIVDDICFHQSQETVDVKRAMFESSAVRILLVDHTKFEKRALYGLARLTEFDHVIVDASTDEDHVRALRDRGINLVVAAQKAEPSVRRSTERQV